MILALVLAQAAVTHASSGGQSGAPLRKTVGPAPSAEKLVSEAQLPKNFDWRSIGPNKRNFVTPDWNQHAPAYCGGCWVHATLSSMSDRIKIYRGGAWPDVMLGRQSVLNCVNQSDGSPAGCSGGVPILVHDYMMKVGVVDETCETYQAVPQQCNPENICRNCATSGECWPVKNHIRYGVSSYGQVIGEKAIMKEIYARGPIACRFATDDLFKTNFSQIALQHEGVYVPQKEFKYEDIDHDMETTGWGETPSGLKYWVVRNSWGTYFGESGWIKIPRGSNVMQSEADCAWAVPTFDDLDQALTEKVLGDYVLGTEPAAFFEQAESPKAEALAAQVHRSNGIAGDVIPALVISIAFFGGVAVALVAVTMRPTRTHKQQSFLG